MRMNPQQEMSAATWGETQQMKTKIAQVLYEYGEERFSRRIARAIVTSRMEKPLETTTELAQDHCSIYALSRTAKTSCHKVLPSYSHLY